MFMVLMRIEETDQGVFGHLLVDMKDEKGTKFDCVTLENHLTLIPESTYMCTIYNSPKLGREVLLVNVPDRTFIEIHNANYASQLEGCIAVGDKRDGNAVNNSVATLEKLIELAKTADKIVLRVTRCL